MFGGEDKRKRILVGDSLIFYLTSSRKGLTMRLVLNNNFKSPRVNFFFLNTLFLLTSLQLIYLKQDHFNVLPLFNQAFKNNQAQVLPITLASKNFKTTTFSQLGFIIAKSSSSKNILTSLNKLKGEEKKIISTVSSSKVFTVSEFKGINLPPYENIEAISTHFNHPNSLKDPLGIFKLNQLIIKENTYQQNAFLIIENSLNSARYNFPRFSRKTNFSEESILFNPYSSVIASWLEKVQHYDQMTSKDMCFSAAFEETIKDLKFLEVLTSNKDLRVPASNPKNDPNVELRNLTAEFFWTLEGNFGLQNGKKSAFNPAIGKFNTDITYENYVPVADFFKTHRVFSCSPDDTCDFIGTHS
ncbi:MAG: hypothetical protein BGO77_08095 [Caedibacter sp. 37-49]|nr:MAG: hypothetical protein BGO77_08095 [Caedibacter sp. 37-49]